MSVGLLIQPEGAVLVAAGTLEADCSSRFALARLWEGKLDRRFGRGGRVLTDFGSRSAVAIGMGAMPDGRVVLAGELKAPEPFSFDCVDPRAHLHLGGAPGFAVARYHPDGTLDTSFDGDGRVLTNLHEAGVADLLVQPDGKVVVVGSSGNRLRLVRYDLRGRLDRSFGSNGKLLTEINVDLGSGRAALDGVGRIVVVDSPNCAPCPASVVRFTRDGRLDRTFGREGRAHSSRLDPYGSTLSPWLGGRSLPLGWSGYRAGAWSSHVSPPTGLSTGASAAADSPHCAFPASHS